MLTLALMINIVIVFCTFRVLFHIKGKWNILKYYTYLQNFIAMMVSFIFSIGLILSVTTDFAIPEYLKGLRYVATCGLSATTFIFVVFLGAGKKIAITEDDFTGGYNPETANRLLHYVCPILSIVSFLLFERELQCSNGIWTAIAPAPSCVYWITYMVLSAMHVWEEPYDFTSSGEDNHVWSALSMALIPLSFVAISYLLWTWM